MDRINFTLGKLMETEVLNPRSSILQFWKDSWQKKKHGIKKTALDDKEIDLIPLSESVQIAERPQTREQPQRPLPEIMIH